MAYKAYTLTTDVFKKPKVFTDMQAVGLLITRLILMEPGTDPLRPEMGVGIVSKYRFIEKGKMHQAEERIQEQMTTYLPNFQTNSVELVQNNDKTLDIIITVNGAKYRYDTKSFNTPITLKSFINN